MSVLHGDCEVVTYKPTTKCK